MELCLGTDEEPAESLYVSIRGQTKTGNVVGVCYRLSDQEKADEASYRTGRSLTLIGSSAHRVL